MKKLLTLALIGAFSTITLTSCSNTGTADSFPEGVNQTEIKSSSKSKGGPLSEDGYLHIVGETDQMFYMGVEVVPVKGDLNDLLNKDIEINTERFTRY